MELVNLVVLLVPLVFSPVLTALLVFLAITRFFSTIHVATRAHLSTIRILRWDSVKNAVYWELDAKTVHQILLAFPAILATIFYLLTIHASTTRLLDLLSSMVLYSCALIIVLLAAMTPTYARAALVIFHSTT